MQLALRGQIFAHPAADFGIILDMADNKEQERAELAEIVERGSLKELKEDYLDYLRRHELALWDAKHPRYDGLLENVDE